MAEELRTVMPLIGSSFEPGQANYREKYKRQGVGGYCTGRAFLFSPDRRRHARRQWKPMLEAEMILFDFLRVCCILFRI